MTKEFDIIKKAALLFSLVALFSVILPNVAFADDEIAITKVLCNVVGQLQGGLGKAIATIAIIVLGISLFLGKLSWPLALVTAIGIGMIFGAANIVEWVGDGTGNTQGTCVKTP
jgi:type IV secretory pathway VirB2 component (pilin)